MTDREADRGEVASAQRVTTEEARRRAAAPEGLGPPAASAEANEPTTAAADRVGAAEGARSVDPGPGAVAPVTGG